jgi:hypothetical protein
MKRFFLLTGLFAFGCCCENPFSRDAESGDAPPPLPQEDQPGAQFDQGVTRLLGPDRKFDPDIRPPFAYSPDPRLPTAPRAEDPSWKNR